MKKPTDCASLEEVRIEIDQIDREIIDLISKRYSFIKEIVKYKSNEVDVKAQKRYDEVFEKRRKWACEKGISPDAIEAVYKVIVHYFIDEQMKMLNSNYITNNH